MNIFLTGGTGFIGSYVVMALIARGHRLTLLARNKNKVAALNEVEGINIVEGDIEDFKLIENLMAGKDACILIALNYTAQAAYEVLLDDTLPTVRISDIAVKAGIKHFIYTSSTSVHDSLYGGTSNNEIAPGSRISAGTRPFPATFYGATKAASENYLIAQSYSSTMRVNIIRPGYTFGNPVIQGASIQSDTRFFDVVQNALANNPISVIRNDGTQFIWAGDLAKLYTEVLHGNVNRKTYFGLSKTFTSWQAIAEQAVKITGSNSEIRIEDKGWPDNGLYWDVSDIKGDFDLEFDSWGKIEEHLDYLIHNRKYWS